MTTWIRFDTDTGVIVSANARQSVMNAATANIPAMLAAGDLEWARALPKVAFDVEAVELAPHEETTIYSFSGEVTDDELTTLRACLQFGRAGQTATLFEEVDASGTTQLFVCNGDGTAAVHAAQLVFPTYARDIALPAQSQAISMSFAIEVWKEALESETDHLDLPAESQALLRDVVRGVLPPPIRSSLSQAEVEAAFAITEPMPRRSRAEPHDGDSAGPATPPAPRL